MEVGKKRNKAKHIIAIIIPENPVLFFVKKFIIINSVTLIISRILPGIVLILHPFQVIGQEAQAASYYENIGEIKNRPYADINEINYAAKTGPVDNI